MSKLFACLSLCLLLVISVSLIDAKKSGGRKPSSSNTGLFGRRDNKKPSNDHQRRNNTSGFGGSNQGFLDSERHDNNRGHIGFEQFQNKPAQANPGGFGGNYKPSAPASGGNQGIGGAFGGANYPQKTQNTHVQSAPYPTNTNPGGFGNAPSGGHYQQPGGFGSNPASGGHYNQPGGFGGTNYNQPGGFGSNPAGGAHYNQPGGFGGTNYNQPGGFGSNPAGGAHYNQPPGGFGSNPVGGSHYNQPNYGNTHGSHYPAGNPYGGQQSYPSGGFGGHQPNYPVGGYNNYGSHGYNPSHGGYNSGGFGGQPGGYGGYNPGGFGGGYNSGGFGGGYGGYPQSGGMFSGGGYKQNSGPGFGTGLLGGAAGGLPLGLLLGYGLGSMTSSSSSHSVSPAASAPGAAPAAAAPATPAISSDPAQNEAFNEWLKQRTEEKKKEIATTTGGETRTVNQTAIVSQILNETQMCPGGTGVLDASILNTMVPCNVTQVDFNVVNVTEPVDDECKSLSLTVVQVNPELSENRSVTIRIKQNNVTGTNEFVVLSYDLEIVNCISFLNNPDERTCQTKSLTSDLHHAVNESMSYLDVTNITVTQFQTLINGNNSCASSGACGPDSKPPRNLTSSFVNLAILPKYPLNIMMSQCMIFKQNMCDPAATTPCDTPMLTSKQTINTNTTLTKDHFAYINFVLHQSPEIFNQPPPNPPPAADKPGSSSSLTDTTTTTPSSATTI